MRAMLSAEAGRTHARAQDTHCLRIVSSHSSAEAQRASYCKRIFISWVLKAELICTAGPLLLLQPESPERSLVSHPGTLIGSKLLEVNFPTLFRVYHCCYSRSEGITKLKILSQQWCLWLPILLLILFIYFYKSDWYYYHYKNIKTVITLLNDRL